MNRRLISFLFLFCSAFFGLANSTQACAVDRLKVLFPAYANPNPNTTDPSGPQMWNNLIATAGSQNTKFDLIAIFNPNNGPFHPDGREGNYLNSDGEGPLADFINAGGIAVGYVATDRGAKPLADAKAEIDAYLNDAELYAGFISGIFFDEMSSNPNDAAYYQELTNHAKNRLAIAFTIGNPGVNPNTGVGGSIANYVNSVDTLITFENFGTEYRDNFMPSSALDNLPREKIGHLIHTESTWDSSLLELASTRGAGWVYFTDDPFVPNVDENPYDKLPTYWEQMSNSISDFNFLLGDMNGDCEFDTLDINPFVLAILDRTAYSIAYPNIDPDEVGDFNGDGVLNTLDISGFTASLLN